MKLSFQILIWLLHIPLYVLRDFAFVNINYQVGFLSASKDSKFELYNYTHSYIEPLLSGFSINELYQLKWVLTFVFSGLFALLSLLLLRTLFSTFKEPLKYTALFYGTILIFSALVYFIFGYSTSREIMSLPQSPIASIVLFFAVKIFKK